MSVLLGLLPLVLAGLLPALAVGGAGPQVLYLTPLLGGLLAGFAAIAEFLSGPGIMAWFTIWAIAANIGALVVLRGRMLRARRGRARTPAGRTPMWAWVAGLVPALAAVWPLTALGVPLVGYDTRAIWILHAMFIYGGHHQFHADVTNPAYLFSNPDYPPLQPAASAISFSMNGRVDYHLAVIVTAVLNAAALGLTSLGILEVGLRLRTRAARAAAVASAGALCLAGFGIAGQYAVNGYADLLWAAAASAAVVYGLVLPRSGRALAIAWVAGTVAALTKNDGLIAATIVFALTAIRYLGTRRDALDGRPAAHARATRGPATVWVARALMAVALAAPGLFWAFIVKVGGVQNAFFGLSRPGTVLSRLTATVSRFWAFLHVVPLAVAVLIAAAVLLARVRRSLGLASSLWAVVATGLWLVALGYTYVFGSFDIDWWLRTSADRTLIFPQLVLLALMTVCAVVAVDALASRPGHASRPAGPLSASERISEPVSG